MNLGKIFQQSKNFFFHYCMLNKLHKKNNNPMSQIKALKIPKHFLQPLQVLSSYRFLGTQQHFEYSNSFLSNLSKKKKKKLTEKNHCEVVLAKTSMWAMVISKNIVLCYFKIKLMLECNVWESNKKHEMLKICLGIFYYSFIYHTCPINYIV